MPKLPPVKRFVADNGVRIYRIPCRVLSNLTARVYLLLGTDVPTLIDTGSGQGESTRHILAGVDAVRTEHGEAVRLADIKRIVLSHTHIDHVGGLWELLDRTDAEVAVHPLECRYIAAGAEHDVLARQRLRRFFDQAGVEPHVGASLLEIHQHSPPQRRDVSVGRMIEDGTQLDGLKFVHTPGHSPGSISLYWPKEKVLITGDAIFYGSIGRTDFPGGSLATLGKSVEKAAKLDVEYLLPGHSTEYGSLIDGKAKVERNFQMIQNFFF